MIVHNNLLSVRVKNVFLPNVYLPKFFAVNIFVLFIQRPVSARKNWDDAVYTKSAQIW